MSTASSPMPRHVRAVRDRTAIAQAAGLGTLAFGLLLSLYFAVLTAISGWGVVAASGTSSTVAMVSCCAHYLANVAPILGATGLVALVAEFQVELFWVGIVLSFAGIVFMANRLFNASR